MAVSPPIAHSYTAEDLQSLQKMCKDGYSIRAMYGSGFLLNIMKGGIATATSEQSRKVNMQALGYMQENCPDVL